MIKGAPATAEATAIPGASATTEIQNYPASDSDPSGASDVVLLCQITGSDPALLDHCLASPRRRNPRNSMNGDRDAPCQINK